MEFFKKTAKQEVINLQIKDLIPNPNQPRKIFQEEELESLSCSIKELGILQPLSVRKTEFGWELIAGERRWRAAERAGLKEVPCLVYQVDEEKSSLLALVENIQRQDLDYIEEAEGMAKLIATYKLSQEEVARRLGKSQSTVANLLRLLRLSPPVIEKLRSGGCTQRHARALLRLCHEEEQLKVLEAVLEKGLNVAQTERLIEKMLSPPKNQDERKSLIVVKDVRIFLNSISKSMEVMKTAGVSAECLREDGEKEIRLTIRIPR